MVSQFLSVTTVPSLCWDCAGTVHINYSVGGLIDISALLGEAGSRDLGEGEEEGGDQSVPG